MAGGYEIGFQEQASTDTTQGLEDPFTNNANFSIYGNAPVVDSGSAAGATEGSAQSTQTESKAGATTSAPTSSGIGPGTGNLASSEGGTSVVVLLTLASILVAIFIALGEVKK